MKSHLRGKNITIRAPYHILPDYMERAREDGFIVFADRKGTESRLKFKEIRKKAKQLGSVLLKMGLKKGDKLVFQISDPQSFIISFWACLYTGIIAVPVTTAAETKSANINKKLEAVLEKLDWPRLILEEELLCTLSEDVKARVNILIFENMKKQAESSNLLFCPEQITGEDTAYIQFSSGSTNSPKGVVLKHRNLIYNVEQIGSRLNLTEKDVSESWMPLTHDMGLVGFHITTFCKGMNQIIFSPMNFIKNPTYFYQKVKEYKTTIMGMPNFAFDWSVKMVKEKYMKTLDLSSIRAVLNGAEPININSIQRFNEKFAACGLDPNAMLPVYGMAEACIGVTIPHCGDKLVEIKKSPAEKKGYVAVGEPLDGIDVKITDENEEILEDGQIGDILIHGPNLTCGYYDSALINEESFSNGYLKTGDMGFIKNGKLFITGRKKDMFFINGQNCYLSDLDILLSENGIKDCAAVYDDEENDLIVFVKHLGMGEKAHETERKIKEAVQRAFHISARHVLNVNNIPKTTSGKVQRYHLLNEYRKTYRNKEDSPISEPLARLWEQILDAKPTDNNSFFDLGGDSIKLIALLNEIEETYGLVIEVEDFLKQPYFTCLNTLVSEKKEAVRNDKEANAKNRELPDAIPATELQKAYLIGREEDISTKVLYELSTPWEIDRLEKAVNSMIRCQPALRLRISREGVMYADKTWDWYHIKTMDISHLSEGEKEKVLDQEFEFQKSQVFDTEKEPLFSIQAIKAGERDIRLLIQMDMLIADGMSLKLFIDGIADYYEHENQDDQPDQRFFLYCLEKQEEKYSRQYNKDRMYWLDKLEEFPPAPPLTENHITQDSLRGFGRKTVTLDKSSWDKIKEGLKKFSVTPSVLILCLYAKILGLYSSTSRFTVNVPVFNRKSSGKMIEAIGDFTSVLLLDIDLSRENLMELCSSVQKNMLEALMHKSFDGIEFMREIAKVRGNKEASFPVVFTSLLSDAFELNLDKIGRMVRGYSQTSQVDLDCQAYEEKGSLVINWDYREGVFENYLLERMFSLFTYDLTGLCTDTGFPAGLSDRGFLKRLLPGDMERIYTYNATEEEIPYVSLNELFVQAHEKFRNKVILSCGENTMSYEHLWEKSGRVKNYLRKKGVTSGSNVAVIGTRDPDTVVNILGVIRSGAAYIPIDEIQPEERRKLILEKSSCSVILERNMDYNGFEDEGEQEETVCAPDDIAYIIYTSGSTGQPKGVYVKHGAAANTILDINRKFHVSEHDVIACVSSIGFDLSVYDIFGALISGAELALIPDVHDTDQMMKILSDRGATVWNSVPALFQLMTDCLKNDRTESEEYFDDYMGNGDAFCRLLSLRLVLLSGDWIPKNLVQDAYGYLENCRIVSLGGATEASVWSIYYDIKEVKNQWASIPYGYPLANQKIYLLDEADDFTPAGVKGQICIGGTGVAEGYYQDPEKTAAAFYEKEGLGRIYHTGDYGVFSEEGHIVFLGRKDGQIKINGFRIELGEIENAVKGLSYVSNAAALVHEFKSGVKSVCAYVCTYETVSESKVKEDLSSILPYYMIPAAIVFLDRIPLTGNGKLDRKSLPEIKECREHMDREPQTKTQKELYEIWMKYLKTENLSVSRPFMELGGDSLAMISVVHEIKSKFGMEIPFREFMTLGSIESIADFVDHRRQEGAADLKEYTTVTGKKEERYDSFPLTDIQRSYFVGRSSGLKMGGVSTHAYYEIENNFDIPRLTRSLNKVIRANPMLRAVVNSDGTQQILENPGWYEIKETDLTALTSEEKKEVLREAREEHSHRVFDQSVFPLFEFFAFRLAEDRVRLLAGFDLLIADGISMRILIREIMRVYEDESITLDENGFTFRDYILSAEEMKKSPYYKTAENYWKKQAESFSGAPELPLIHTPKEFEKPVFHRLIHKISIEKWQALKEKISAHSITASTFLMTVYGRILAVYSNRNSVTLNVTVFTRFPFDQAVKNMVGDFTSVMLLDINGESAALWEECLNVQRKISENLEHMEYDGVSVIKEVSKKQKRVGELLFPYVFTGMIFENEDGISLENMGELVYSVSQTSQVYLDCQVMTGSEGLSITWDYVQQLFDPVMMERMFERYTCMIEAAGEGSLISERDLALVDQYNQTDCDLESVTLLDAFEKQVLLRGSQTALITREGAYTYQMINGLAEKMAAGLKKRGLKSGDKAAVYEYRNARTIAAILAVLKCRGVYVPISPLIPEDRKEYIRENSGYKLEVTADLAEELMKETEGLLKETGKEEDDTAYIIYTSGSTGVPKGVVITHREAMNTILDVNRRFKITENDRILGVSSFTFDLSVYDIFGTFAAGGTLILAEDSKNAEELNRLVSDEAVTVWNSVPALFELLLSARENDEENYFDEISQELEVKFEQTQSLRVVMLSGDYIPVDLPDRIRNRYENARVISLGGATEGSIWSVYYPVNEVGQTWTTIPYGYPLGNQKLYILDDHQNICPVGVPGEIAIGGAGVAEGYCNDPEKTSQSFLRLESLGRIYRTGDMGVLTEAGYIGFLGRRDNQVKINGYRVELGEIESALLRFEGVKSAVSTVSAENRNRLIACFTSDEKLSVDRIREFLAEKLPHYMMPALIRQIETIPLTANGKTDRKQLSHLDKLSDERKVLAPETDNQKILYQYFKDVLGLNQFSIRDNFFELGGDSIKGITLYNKINEVFEADMNLIFQYQTVEALAARLKKRKNDYKEERLKQFKQQYYAAIDTLEAQKRLDDDYNAYLDNAEKKFKSFSASGFKDYKTALLTGATGYLGANLMEALLTMTDMIIFALVRGDDYINRLKENLEFYFGEEFYSRYSNRIVAFQGDLSQDMLGQKKDVYESLAKTVDTVFHCAGKVEHFGKYEDFYRSNVKSVENLLKFSMVGKQKELCHMSTTRVMESIDSNDMEVLFHEDFEAMNGNAEELYVRSKKEAEDLIREYRKMGAMVKVFRIGTIVFDSRNGKFQRDIDFNSFYLIMQAFFELGAMPDVDATLLDFTFVDECSKAIVKLAMEKEVKDGIYHVYNENKLGMYEFYDKLKRAGMKENLEIMEFSEFFDFVYDSYKNESMEDCINTLLLHSSAYMSLEGAVRVIVNDYTRSILECMGFKWSRVSEDHIRSMLEYGKKIGFFKKEVIV
ncbi:amino acid adenylation domain-containing protein [Lacrimispora amygdalina]|uniref:Amino acid adenylation domain-containing protein n=1 Tax=Lacrimispora amygdalina TaxID=253257 RepID=A0A3E2N7Q3_9FIRM|nr:non-ribosomal peptide synthetase [Clostridium indicum]RFZ76921.1 amino acid adenylation domain-containing protein [Clostridium indicum]